MSTAHSRERGSDARPLSEALVDFVQAFDTWSRRMAVASARESVPRLRLLYELHCNGPRKMADLAETLGVTPRNVTALVDALEAEALVRRTPHPTDRRVTLVEITGGAAAVEDQFASFHEAIDDLLADLSDADRRTLTRVLPRLEARIHEPEG
jgi:DNA-binding MarR family transcriptional regulator